MSITCFDNFTTMMTTQGKYYPLRLIVVITGDVSDSIAQDHVPSRR